MREDDRFGEQSEAGEPREFEQPPCERAERARARREQTSGARRRPVRRAERSGRAEGVRATAVRTSRASNRANQCGLERARSKRRKIPERLVRSASPWSTGERGALPTNRIRSEGLRRSSAESMRSKRRRTRNSLVRPGGSSAFPTSGSDVAKRTIGAKRSIGSGVASGSESPRVRPFAYGRTRFDARRRTARRSQRRRARLRFSRDPVGLVPLVLRFWRMTIATIRDLISRMRAAKPCPCLGTDIVRDRTPERSVEERGALRGAGSCGASS